MISAKSALVYPFGMKKKQERVALMKSVMYWWSRTQSVEGAQCTAETDRWSLTKDAVMSGRYFYCWLTRWAERMPASVWNKVKGNKVWWLKKSTSFPTDKLQNVSLKIRISKVQIDLFFLVNKQDTDA